MADEKKPWTPRWGRWKPRLKWLTIAVITIALVAAVVWWFDFGTTSSPGVYEVYARTTFSNEDPDSTSADIKLYLTENFHPDKYEYVGIVAQRLPTSQSPSTTTYVLFKRK